MHNSLWSTYTVAATIPIAIIMGLYKQIWRKGDVLGASIIGVVLLALCILTGPYVAAHPETFGWLDIDKKPMSILIPVYGFAASVLPVWMLLLPREYLSTFLKIGTSARWPSASCSSCPTSTCLRSPNSPRAAAPSSAAR